MTTTIFDLNFAGKRKDCLTELPVCLRMGGDMKLNSILATITILCALAAAALGQSATPSPSPAPSATPSPAETPQASPTPGSPQAPPSLPARRNYRISQGVAEKNKVHNVTPEYPIAARANMIEGDVLLKILIGRNGDVESLETISGHPMLAQAAMNAVKKWKYKPLTIHGEAVPVETTVKISYHMHR
jgi:TonB family protein